MRAYIYIPLFSTIHFLAFLASFYLWSAFEFEGSSREVIAEKVMFALTFPLAWLTANTKSLPTALLLILLNSILWGTIIFVTTRKVLAFNRGMQLIGDARDGE